MPRVFTRPDSPYDNADLPNDKKYVNLTTVGKPRPPKAQEFDDEANYYIDSMNLLSRDIDAVRAGSIPGSEDPNNAGKYVTTDGASTLSFVKITGDSFDDDSIPGRKIVGGSIGPEEIEHGAITEEHLQNFCVTRGKIDQKAVSRFNIAGLAVGSEELGLKAVLEKNLGDSVVTTQKLNDGAATAPKLADSAVTNPKLGPLAVTADKMAPNSVPTEKIPDGAVTNPKLGPLAVTADKMALKTVTYSQISDSFAATKLQQQTANSSQVFVSPATQQQHPSAASFWVDFNGANGSVFASYNVSSVTRNSAGNYTINFTNNFSSSNYVPLIAVRRAAASGNAVTTIVNAQSASSITIVTYDSAGLFSDYDDVYVVGFGKLV